MTSSLPRQPYEPERLLAVVMHWGEARDWIGWDPYDALNSPFAPYLTFNTDIGRRILTQVVKRSPVNLRRVLRVPPSKNPMSVALVASGYSRLATTQQAPRVAKLALRHFDWLLSHASHASSGMAWGYDFEVQTRFFRYARLAPNTIATSFTAHALLDGYEAFGRTQDLEAVSQVVEYFLAVCLMYRDGDPYFNYVDRDTSLIHNANLLAASVIVRYARLSGAPLPSVAGGAVRTSLLGQRPDGSWPYSDRPEHSWVDSFHTGYVLEALSHCTDLPNVSQSLSDGANYWRNSFFLEDGRLRYAVGNRYPIDAQVYAQGIETLLACKPFDPGAVLTSLELVRHLVDDLLSAEGFIYAQRGRHILVRAPVVRWSNAAVFRALAALVAVLAKGDDVENTGSVD